MRAIRGKIFDTDGMFKEGEIIISGDTISEVKFLESGQLSEEEKQRLVIPGLIDIHMHGAYGHDACNCDAKDLKEIADYERNNGVTSFCIATMTMERDNLVNICNNISSEARNNVGIKGIYLEGPFISEQKAGAQNPEHILAPDYDLYRELQSASAGMIKVVTIAPEKDGAIDFIRKVCGEIEIGLEGSRVSIAHTIANAKEAKEAFDAGAKQVTHLYNAMTPMSHREPGVVGAAADSSDVMVELICDGIHVDSVMIRNTFRLFGSERIILISDSMEATGMPDGTYILGDLPVKKQGCKVTLKEAANDKEIIAGSASNLYQCMINAIEFGIKAEDAILAATKNPAIAIGIFDKAGSIEEGKTADLLIINDRYELIKVVTGEIDSL